MDAIAGVLMFFFGWAFGIWFYKNYKRDNIVPCDCGYVKYMEYQKLEKK